MNIEYEFLPGICFHVIDLDGVKTKWDETIKELRGGGGTKQEIAAVEELKRERVDHAERHNTLHGLDEKAIGLEYEMEEIRKMYEAKDLTEAAVNDRNFKRLRDKWNEVGSTCPYYMIAAGSSRHTALKTHWEILRDLVGDESLVGSGTDEQHEREIFDPY